ncbi:MAG: DUF3685 domain-containing protein [Cyanothece sp. SIO2G6]|nr:DUF3685 domain-containing protein [Cyanothece sp. SIO2G6]
MMASSSASNPPIVRIVIVDDDPIFRVGLRDWFNQWPNFEVIEDIGDQTLAFRRLQARLDVLNDPEAESESRVEQAEDGAGRDETGRDETGRDETGRDETVRDGTGPGARSSGATTQPMLVILGGAIAADDPSYRALIDLCQQLKTQYPTLPLLVLGTDAPEVMAAMPQTGVDGYVSKAEAASQLPQVMQQVLAGEFQWPTLSPSAPGSLDDASNQTQEAVSPTPATTPATRVGPFSQLRCRWRMVALRQIEAQLCRLQPYAIAIRTKRLDTTEWSVVDRWIILGRCRELHTARWLIRTLLATPALEYSDWTGGYRPDAGELADVDDATDPIAPAITQPSSLFTRWRQQLGAIAQQPVSPDIIRPSGRMATPLAQTSALQPRTQDGPPTSLSSLSPPPGESVSPATVRATLFEALRERLQSPLTNQTEQPLEIDILRPERKRELLVLALHKLLALLDDLRYSDVQFQQLQERRSQLFYDLWQSILTDYFGKYYVMQVDGLELEVVTILSQDARVVQRSIFARIPFALDLLAHLLFQSPLEIDGVPYELGTPEAFERAEIILDNLVIQLGNSVIQPLLNHLADVELIKQNFYDYRCISSRDIAQFRNALSWRYRRLQYFDEPTAIFESTYYLLTVQGLGIKQTAIYASRRPELDRLSGIPLSVTLLLELRDALSPRFREAIAAVGAAVIYVLTDVIGRGIGLIGRGIIKGIGSAWQDPRNGM